ncbi:MAG: glycoside hydrolase family 3 C-terminal domain-containing protein [Actinomycetota bacterium]
MTIDPTEDRPRDRFGPRTEEVLPQLTMEEKARLTAGSGLFTMPGVERFGIRDWMTTDGPNGARGTSFMGSGDAKATCIPSGSALGATWDPDLVEELGVLLGAETRTKAARVLLAPTVNLHRSPLAGRNFECFSEDPLLTGKLAAAFIRGVQSQGVITTVKHFVGNECETDRWTSDSIIDERAMRELYLVPFELAVTEGGTLGIMTAYNRLNGAYCTEQPWLLTELLRNEWGFEGLITTDWASGADTVRSAEAGLTIEMPAGDRIYGSALADAVTNGQVDEARLDELAGRLLSTFEAVGAWDDEPSPEQSIDDPANRALARRAASQAMVLYRNEPVGFGGSLLPLDDSSVESIAVIGPNAARAQIMGGGSANLRPFHRTSPLAALQDRLGDEVTITHEPGVDIDARPPLLSGPALVDPEGLQGFGIEVFDNPTWSGEPVGTTNRDTGRILFGTEPLPGLSVTDFSVRASTTWTPTESGQYGFRLTQISSSRLLIDGELVVDGITERPPRDSSFFGFGSRLPIVTRDLEAGRSYHLELEFTDRQVPIAGADLRVRTPFPDDGIERAVAAAAAADVAVVVVGTTDDWETEGEDRTFLALPGDQDALVSAVAAVNPRTVVVVNTGSPVTMPWVQEVPAIFQSWLGGQEMADALVDVLTGAADPGGRLPTTFPLRIEHTPSFGNFPGDNGRVPYAEGLFVGYRWYDSRQLPVCWPFGHGLSYTTFEIGQPVPSASSLPVGETVTVAVPVTNTGDRPGRHVVQCYVRPNGSRIVRPDQELKAFASVALEPGESTTVTLTLDERAFAYWDPGQPEWPELRDSKRATLPQFRHQERRTEAGWVIEPGAYEVVIANSVADPVVTVVLELTEAGA